MQVHLQNVYTGFPLIDVNKVIVEVYVACVRRKEPRSENSFASYYVPCVGVIDKANISVCAFCT